MKVLDVPKPPARPVTISKLTTNGWTEHQMSGVLERSGYMQRYAEIFGGMSAIIDANLPKDCHRSRAVVCKLSTPGVFPKDRIDL